MTHRNRLLSGTKIFLVGAMLTVSGCEVTLVESQTSNNIRQARAGTQRGDVGAAEQLLRQAVSNARTPRLRTVAQYELGRLLYSEPTNNQRREEGLQLIAAAAASYPAAQRRLGEIYAEGDGVRRDLARAAQLYRAAASGGSAGAQIDLAELIRENPSYGSASEASRLAQAGIAQLQRDSRRGDANASRRLGQIYRDGIIVSANRAESERYLSLAVEQGQRSAVTDLADLWMEGSPADQQRALQLLEQGADHDIERAVVLLGDLYRDGTITQADRDRAIAYYLQGSSAEGTYDDATVSRIASTLRRGGVSASRRQEAMTYLQGAAQAGSGRAALELGKIYEASSSYSAAARYYRASSGFAESRMRLGRLYYEGRGVSRDYAEAVRLLQSAANSGNQTAAAYLGRAYAEGNGVAQDWNRARPLLERGVRSGSISATVLLAQANEQGLGGPVDLQEAFRLFKIAAEGGSVTAMTKVAEMYRLGRGVAQSDSRARQWTERAAQGGSSGSLVETGWAYATGDGVPQNMAQAREYFDRAIQQDPSKAGVISRALRDGSRGVTDLALAEEYAAIAAESGDIREVRNQARAVEEQDFERAREMYRQAAEGGDAVAMMWMADQAFAAQDADTGRRWLESASEAGSGTAALRLGSMYAFGDGVPINLGRALEFFKRGAELGNGEAMYWVSQFYRQGLGVAVDTDLADEWLERARAAGYTNA